MLAVIAVCIAKTFRINEIASRLPILVKTEKSKQKRLLRFLDTALPIACLEKAWLTFVVGCFCSTKGYPHFLILVDETDLIDGWKAIVAAIPFRSNLICGHQLYHIYKRRMQIEHGFRDIKSCFGFGKLVLKKPTYSRGCLLWLLASVAYGNLLFLSYEKASTQWAKAFNGSQKRYSVNPPCHLTNFAA
ncbi:MAG: hypothetical protein OXU23_17995 [Candidatus Poribacteria bacterium]|nr:hypothetical protein [Candidatus Poribacteria bacterium]